MKNYANFLRDSTNSIISWRSIQMIIRNWIHPQSKISRRSCLSFFRKCWFLKQLSKCVLSVRTFRKVPRKTSSVVQFIIITVDEEPHVNSLLYDIHFRDIFHNLEIPNLIAPWMVTPYWQIPKQQIDILEVSNENSFMRSLSKLTIKSPDKRQGTSFRWLHFKFEHREQKNLDKP